MDREGRGRREDEREEMKRKKPSPLFKTKDIFAKFFLKKGGNTGKVTSSGQWGSTTEKDPIERNVENLDPILK